MTKLDPTNSTFDFEPEHVNESVGLCSEEPLLAPI